MGYLEACDTLINEPNPFRMDIERANTLRFEAIRGSFEHHYANNGIYRDFCKAMNVKPDEIKTLDDVPKIALITSEFFKQISAYSDEKDLKRIISVPPESIIKHFTTSGTTGKPSKYPFDRDSLIRLSKSNAQILKCIGDVSDDDKYIFLTADPEHTPTGLVQGMYQSIETNIGKERAKEQVRFAVSTEGGKSHYQIDKILNFLGEGGVVHLFGPPFAYQDVAKTLKSSKTEVKMGEHSKAFTSGGWKGRQHEMITPRELNAMIKDAYGIEECNVRDGLGLTDVFSWLLECEHKRKHVPPWMHVSPRLESDNMEDIKIMMPQGQQGVIAFLTPIISSYPAFITTGDLGLLTTGFDEKCECGNIGPTVKYGGRSGDPRGCALVEMEKMQRSIFDMSGSKAGSAKPIDDPAATTQRGPKPPVNNGYEGHAML